MPTSRLEAFSDGVLAIAITVMVLELKMPEGDTLADLWHSTGLGLLTYLLSFIYVGIYWNNHHHLLHAVGQVRGGGLWANLGLLFCLSLMPFTTGWMDDTHFAKAPVLVYGVTLLAAALAYVVLEAVLLRGEGPDSPARRALRHADRTMNAGRKGAISLGVYSLGIVTSALDGSVLPDRVGCGVALGCYVLVALIWLVPDRRLEREVGS